MQLIPKLTINGLLGYALVAAGVALGAGIFAAPMKTLEDNLRRA